MGRLGWYAGVSTALAAGVVASAFNQRANFYSACVYLQQSNLCLMVIINLVLLVYSSIMFGFQRLCYGPLRSIEIEQLYEKGWFAVTETCLAMTIFREEVGPWFLVMFVALITGKVWGWIGDGRVEILEQQPPANPRLFHFRLSVSLAISVMYDIWLMSYAISTVIQQARPNMMVMFLFEFTILTTSSVSTAIRYLISLHEIRLVKNQTKERLAERRRELREERAEMIRQRQEAAAEAAATGGEIDEALVNAPLPSEDDVEELDIEVPGWETKGQWILTLDLVTDFAKLTIYITFFFILLLFYGIPIHIMRDLFMTTRSFLKRLTAFLRYRRATHEMNKRYEDATVEDIEREDTCIICREEMRPWSVTNPQAAPAAPGAAPTPRPATTASERKRPKKLPCGHILHLGCLKSWLERQQVCPTCRRPVVDNPQAARDAANNANRVANGAQPPGGGPGDAGGAGGAGGARPGRRPPRPNMRVLNLGPFRVGFGQANLQDLAAINGADVGDNAGRVYGLELGMGRRPPAQAQPQAQDGAQTRPQDQRGADMANHGPVQDRLQQIEQHISSEIRALQLMEQELQVVQLLQNELARLRHLQSGASDPSATNIQTQLGGSGTRHTMPPAMPQLQRHGARGDTLPIPAGSSNLPPGVTIPDGWSLLPLQRLDGSGPLVTRRSAGAIPSTRTVPTPTTTQQSNSTIPTIFNATRNPAILRPNPEHTPQVSSPGSSDSNAIPTPSSVSANQSSPSVLSTSGATPPSIIPAAGTATTPGSSEPQMLPNWGSSQLYSNPGQNTTTGNGNRDLPPGLNASGSDVPMDAGQSSSMSRGASEGGSDIQRREAGMARAATVEDTTDDAE